MLKTTYSSQETESKWYAHWLAKNYFHSTPDEREPFTIVIPPPNVTGVLHMGHLLNNTIQDILIRKARMEGKNACWVPGTDHASIATEAKVVKMLREKGIKKGDIGREEFLKHAFEWKDKYGGIILDQLKMLGASCDWERTRFTMEPKLSAAVIKVFVKLYNKGLLYRGVRMCNWDPEAKTVLSNEEVIYSDEKSRLYYVQYKVEGSDEFITIATTRPETIMGDTAVAVNPDDERYAHLKGKRCIVPIVNRSVPIVFDSYIDATFGTGALKVTPAHDINDYEIGIRHGLEVVDVFNDDGTMSEASQFCIGEDRFEVRKKMKKVLEDLGVLVKIEEHQNRVGRSERTSSVVEPRLKLQWWLKMDGLSEQALGAVESGEVNFFPEHFKNTYRNWLTNSRDWCISRQLWWGQQIPAYYTPDGNLAVAESKEEALAILNAEHNNKYQLADLQQDEDVVDTWFSSWLWPISVFDGFETREEVDYYYPTNVLVTGWDIIYFWVARMIMAGYEFEGKHPFKDVYFTGMVRDQFRRKMSKSLGNSPDAIELLEKYGADGVRFGLLSSSPAGGDLVFDAPFDKETKEILSESALCEQGSKFCNKLWQALRLIKGWDVDANLPQPTLNVFAAEWIEQKYNSVIAELDGLFKTYRLSEALNTLYAFLWDDFCALYLEMVKPDYQAPIDTKTLEQVTAFYEKFMTLLHPFMPFVTEEVWNNLRERQDGDDCCISKWPKAQSFDKGFLFSVSTMQDTISKIRESRNNNQLKPKELLPLFVKDTPAARALFENKGLYETVIKLGFLSELSFTNEEKDGASFIAGTEQYYLVFQKEINVEEERARLSKELEQAHGFVKSVESKLQNERFVQNAKPEVVETERKKLADGQARVALLEASLAKL